jgi:hypothetical protein
LNWREALKPRKKDPRERAKGELFTYLLSFPLIVMMPIIIYMAANDQPMLEKIGAKTFAMIAFAFALFTALFYFSFILEALNNYRKSKKMGEIGQP